MSHKRRPNPKDITDLNLIYQAIYSSFEGKMRRNSVRQLIKSYGKETQQENIDALALDIQKHLIDEDRENDVYRITERYDPQSRKTRKIASTSALSQIYHWVFVLSCKDIFMQQIYTYQVASIPNRGAHYGKYHLEKWLTKSKYRSKDKRKKYNYNTDTKYCLKIDIRKCYQHIKPELVMKLLKKKIRDKKVLWLAETILFSYDDGLPIGSITSQWFCNYTISYICHYLKEVERVKHVMFYMDDGVIFSNSRKKLLKIKHNLDKVCGELGLEIKPNWRIFLVDRISDKSGKREGCFIDFMGFKFYRDHTTIRKTTAIKIMRKYRLAEKKIRNGEYLSPKFCAGALSYLGYVKHTNSHKFKHKYIHNSTVKILKGVVAHESRKQSKARNSCN